MPPDVAIAKKRGSQDYWHVSINGRQAGFIHCPSLTDYKAVHNSFRVWLYPRSRSYPQGHESFHKTLDEAKVETHDFIVNNFSNP